jgi:hypothetical protein
MEQRTELSNMRRRDRVLATLSIEGRGRTVHTEIQRPPIHLQVGHERHHVYKMASFKEVKNYNGTGTLS